jgi:hypothetical protein
MFVVFNIKGSFHLTHDIVVPEKFCLQNALQMVRSDLAHMWDATPRGDGGGRCSSPRGRTAIWQSLPEHKKKRGKSTKMGVKSVAYHL